jgi:type II secretory pathway pseudopilin PulG
MFREHKRGISTIEVIITLAISAAMFVIVIGAFNLRKRTQVDDAARQVMSEIAKVRNAAQQGEGPTTEDGEKRLTTGGPNELFGEAIEFIQSNCPTAEDSCIRVYKLMQTPTGTIKVFEQYDIKLQQKLAWYLPFDNAPECTTFTSCYTKPGESVPVKLTDPPVSQGTYAWSVIVVFRNNSGEGFVFNRATFATDPAIAGTPALASMLPWANNPQNYTANRQGELRVAFAVPGLGSDPNARMANAPYQYYAKFDLSVPNNQSLEVVK